ncbi:MULTISPECIES: chalcone isomerase family protein [unclassified Shewanella]|uniref:chalcone isomerase family protein n=1 Tax=unclassified Shewanella TaxID=196818 RepID=UPI000C842932|nr:MULTISPECIES: chalcone isomerase family protein [unclassified Shewanella]MDO6620992.1 chalcone isomerase family protein [Shewanella sp. 6_MG-2023]MDO6641920.1 chalcone isomerase family protein [Shewanella sp. 5_MG-2023]MDO6680381.1 chalcone isomerase family protein [Shewanella sp. 4_MG-2023]MDO6777395.1 chalcone isomerase family protein [Shewanella sp. 3_MG-2023]
MIKRIITATSLMFVCASASAAVDISGVSVPENVTLNNSTMVLNGAGVRSKFFIDLYVGSLFTTSTSTQAQQVIDSDSPTAIRLNITSDMITSEKMIDALNEGFDRATNGKTEPIAASIESLINSFSDPIKSGDQFTLMSVPGEGVISYKNGQQLAVTPGEDFRKAVLSVWLGKKPTDKGLKKSMLKG